MVLTEGDLYDHKHLRRCDESHHQINFKKHFVLWAARARGTAAHYMEQRERTSTS